MKKLLFLAMFALVAGLAQAQTAKSQTPKKKTVSDYYNAVITNDGNSNHRKVINDTKNGFIKYEGSWEGWGEIVMWRWGSKDLVAVATTGCGPACDISVDFYYGNNLNSPVNSIVLPEDDIEALFSQFDGLINQTDTEEIRQKNGKIYVGDATRWYKLPQTGRVLQIGYLVNQNGAGQKFVPIADLTPNAVNTKFSVSKKYTLAQFK